MTHEWLGCISACLCPVDPRPETHTVFLLLFPTVEDGVPRTARSMSLTMGKVWMAEELQGSQKKHVRSFHGHSNGHSLLDTWVPVGSSTFTLAHMAADTPSFLLGCSLPNSSLT